MRILMGDIQNMKEQKLKRNFIGKIIKGIMGIVIFMVIGIMIINSLDNNEIIHEANVEILSNHDYDWSKLIDNNGRKSYVDNEGNEALSGIDVSTYQGDIEWDKVKSDNIDFAIIRAGYRGYESGEINEDDKFKKNISGAINNGIDVGVYFFSQAISEEEAKEEAEFILDAIKGYEVKYPIVFDMEYVENGRINSLSMEERTNITLAFCEVIKNAGYEPMIYGNQFWLQEYVSLHDINDYELWLAQYNERPNFPYEFRVWQYTDSGQVDGIEGNVDLNLWFKSVEK